MMFALGSLVLFILAARKWSASSRWHRTAGRLTSCRKRLLESRHGKHFKFCLEQVIERFEEVEARMGATSDTARSSRCRRNMQS